MEDIEEIEEVAVHVCNTTLADTNCTLYEETEITEGPGPENIIVPLVLGVAFIIGVSGNTFLLWFIVRVKRRRYSHLLLIANLAASDLSMLVIGMPFVSTIYTFEDWPFGLYVCKLSEFAQTLSAAAAILSLTALSADRYFIVSRRGASSGFKSSIVVISAIWATSLLFALPDLISSTILTFGSLEFCVVYPESLGTVYANIHVIMKFIYLFVLPTLTIVIFYTLIAFKLVTQNDFLPASDAKLLRTNEPSRTRISRHGIARTVVSMAILGLVAVFILTWLPRYVYLMWYHFDSSEFNEFWHAFKIVSFCLMFMNAVLNPFIYCAIDRSFRRRLFRFLSCKTESTHETSKTDSDLDDHQQITLTVLTKQLESSEHIP